MGVIQSQTHIAVPPNNSSQLGNYGHHSETFQEPYTLVIHKRSKHIPPQTYWVWPIQNQPTKYGQSHQSTHSQALDPYILSMNDVGIPMPNRSQLYKNEHFLQSFLILSSYN